MVHIATSDVDARAKLAGLELLSAINQRGSLADDDLEQTKALVFDINAQVAATSSSSSRVFFLCKASTAPLFCALMPLVLRCARLQQSCSLSARAMNLALPLKYCVA